MNDLKTKWMSNYLAEERKWREWELKQEAKTRKIVFITIGVAVILYAVIMFIV